MIWFFWFVTSIALAAYSIHLISRWPMTNSGFPVSPAKTPAECGLKIGSFYWVRKAPLLKSEDGRTLVQGEISSLFEPARFTGSSGGSPPMDTWDFIGIASEEETAIVIEIGPEIRQV